MAKSHKMYAIFDETTKRYLCTDEAGAILAVDIAYATFWFSKNDATDVAKYILEVWPERFSFLTLQKITATTEVATRLSLK